MGGPLAAGDKRRDEAVGDFDGGWSGGGRTMPGTSAGLSRHSLLAFLIRRELARPEEMIEMTERLHQHTRPRRAGSRREMEHRRRSVGEPSWPLAPVQRKAQADALAAVEGTYRDLHQATESWFAGGGSRGR